MKDIFSKLIFILKSERAFFLVTITYGIAISLLTLAIPISVQALINTVTFGVFLQPLVMIAFGLLVVLVLSGILRSLQVYTIEMFQRHFFARTVKDITINLLESNKAQLKEKNGVELVNRYFEIMTIQKVVTLLLTDFFSIILQTLVGLLLIAFYHPYFLIFDISLVLMLVLTWWFWGKRSVYTAINESKVKYKVANWLQETARCQSNLQTRKKMTFFANKADALVEEYLFMRKKHFNYLFGQTIFLLSIYAFFSAMVMAIGGYLVVMGELSIGQLVAVELIITVVLSSIAKSGKYFESFYDLIAAIDKLYQLYILKRNNNLFYQDEFEIKEIHLNSVQVKTKGVCFNLNFKISPEESKAYFVQCDKYSGKSIFLDLLFKTNEQYQGQILINNEDISFAPELNLNDQIMLFAQNTSFYGTIEENLDTSFSDKSNEIKNALQAVDLYSTIESLAQKEKTSVLPSGFPLWPSEILRLELAKVIMQKPKFLILNERFVDIDRNTRSKILDSLDELNICIVFLYKEPLRNNSKVLCIDIQETKD